MRIRKEKIYLIVILVLKGKGPLVNPTSGSSEGGPAEDEVREKLNVLKILAKNIKFSILASDSPRHLHLPIPKGKSNPLLQNSPLVSRNLSGLNTSGSPHTGSMWRL